MRRRRTWLGAFLGASSPSQFGADCLYCGQEFDPPILQPRKRCSNLIGAKGSRGPETVVEQANCPASGSKLDLRLFEHPGLDFVMPHAQEIEGATPVVFLGDCRRLMSLDLGDDADRNFDPL